MIVAMAASARASPACSTMIDRPFHFGGTHEGDVGVAHGDVGGIGEQLPVYSSNTDSAMNIRSAEGRPGAVVRLDPTQVRIGREGVDPELDDGSDPSQHVANADASHAHSLLQLLRPSRRARNRAEQARVRAEFRTARVARAAGWGRLGLGEGEVDDGDEAPLAVAGGIDEALRDDPAAGFLDEREVGRRPGVGVDADAVVLGPVRRHRLGEPFLAPAAAIGQRAVRPGGQQLDPAERGGAHRRAPRAGGPAAGGRAPRAPGGRGPGATGEQRPLVEQRGVGGPDQLRRATRRRPRASGV